MPKSRVLYAMRHFRWPLMGAIFFFSVEIKNGYFCELFVMLPIVFQTENFAWRFLYTYINLNFFFFLWSKFFFELAVNLTKCGIQELSRLVE